MMEICADKLSEGKTTEKCLEFVRSVLNPSFSFPIITNRREWTDLCVFSQKQAISGIVFEGIQRYYDQTGKNIPSDLVIEWCALYEQIKQRNKLLNKRCVEVTSFFEEKGLRSCILKGQGNALMYPNPDARMSGDIDIWIEGKREAIKKTVRDKVGNTFETSHHIALPMFDDVDIEVHFTPAEFCNPIYNRHLQCYFISHQAEQMSNMIEIPETNGKIGVPTNLFNAVFQLSHIMYHFFIEGVGLRHFIDYYYLLIRGFSQHEKKEYARTVEKLGMLYFSRSVMWIEQQILGLNDRYLLVAPHEVGGRLLLDEILATGNMGHYDERLAFRKKGFIARGITDAFRDLYLARVFPSEGYFKPIQKIASQRWKLKYFLTRILKEYF